MFGAPSAECAQGLDQLFTGTRERIGDLRRRGMFDHALYDSVRLQLAELGGQNLLTDAGKELTKFGETFGAETQMPDRQDLPLAADDVDGSLHGATEVIFHRHLPGLPNCAYFR